jgi:hypothetical protein
MGGLEFGVWSSEFGVRFGTTNHKELQKEISRVRQPEIPYSAT